MPKPRLGFWWEYEISDLMINKGWENSPQQILEYFKAEAVDDPRYAGYPALRTIAKYMSRIRQGSVALTRQRKDFEYPIHMGSGKSQVPWELSRYALDCLNFYAVNHGIRPSIGLIKRFASVAAASQEPIPLPDQQKSVYAEMFWYADLIGATSSRKRPSTVIEELNLATRAWTASNPKLVPNLAATLGVTEQWAMPKGDLGFLKYMPEFAKTFSDSPFYDEQLTQSDVLDEMDSSSDDFSWYTENILKKFPDVR